MNFKQSRSIFHIHSTAHKSSRFSETSIETRFEDNRIFLEKWLSPTINMPRHIVVKGETLTVDQVACLDTVWMACLCESELMIQIVALSGGGGGRDLGHRSD